MGNGIPWVKKEGNAFEVSMGTYDGAETCEVLAYLCCH